MSTLLLNATYEPLTVIDWRKALCLVMLGKADAIELYEDVVHSANASFARPAVLRLRHRVRWQRKTIRFSRQHVYLRDRYMCQYCTVRKTRADLTFDHVIPRTRGGRTNWQNIVTCCFECNQRKADRTPEEAGMTLVKQPYAPRWLPVDTDSERYAATAELWEPYLWT